MNTKPSFVFFLFYLLIPLLLLFVFVVVLCDMLASVVFVAADIVLLRLLFLCLPCALFAVAVSHIFICTILLFCCLLFGVSASCLNVYLLFFI